MAMTTPTRGKTVPKATVKPASSTVAPAGAAVQPPVTPRIAAAVGISNNSLSKPKGELSKLMDKAMADAVLQANKEGISVENSDEIRKRMMAAREKVKAEWNGPPKPLPEKLQKKVSK